MDDDIIQEEIGSVVADEFSPTFDCFRIKADADKYVYPGTLVGTLINENRFLIGRIKSSLEVNPHESASRSKVREALDIQPDYPEEKLSTNIYRVYEADVIEEGIIKKDGDKRIIEIAEPSDMPKAGARAFLPTEEIIANAMGFLQKEDEALVLGRTTITSGADEDEKPKNNVLLKPSVIQRHVFIGGTTGSGKSYGTGVILEEVNKFGIPIIILDSQNEYIGVAEGLGGTVLKPGDHYKVRLSSLTEGEILGLVPTLPEVGRNLLAFTFLRLKREIRQRSRISFGVQELLSEMSIDAPALQVNANSLQIALQRTRSSLERHKFLGNVTNWQELLEKFPVVNIDCGDLDQHQLQLVVGATLRELQSLRKNGLIPPYVTVLDEAHLLVPEGEDSPCKQVIREGVRIGRHYGICMFLITQSPVDIDKKTIRQCNTRFIFALEPDQLESIKGVRADATQEMLTRLPKMPVGTCILSGTYETVRHAIPIKIRERVVESGGQTPNIFAEIKEKWTKKKK